MSVIPRQHDTEKDRGERAHSDCLAAVRMADGDTKARRKEGILATAQPTTQPPSSRSPSDDDSP